MILDQSLKDQDLISDLCKDQDHLKRSLSWQEMQKNLKMAEMVIQEPELLQKIKPTI